ncbi:MAG: HNH endonuclease [Victivallales bacterium]|nr:HNH endonuclease [Victivallales bacterium]
MKIEQRKVTVGEVCEGYFNDDEEGVTGYGERLNIRPRYQREFVYKDAQRDEVVRTVMKGLPLNVIYWCKVKLEDGGDGFEVLDGQQRTLSLCEYVDGGFSVDDKYFYNLPKDRQESILNYPLFVYVCDGTDSEKLDWFRIINIAGEQLTDQELRNAVYAGPWTADAKRYFSKTGCAAATLAGDYLKGASIRQEYLETAILWAASAEGKGIEAYMAEHQNDPSAIQLWNYFRSVIDWVQAIFPKKRKEMKGLPWGLLFNQHGKRTDLAPKALEQEIQRLLGDEDVTRKPGIYEYLLTGDERKLSIRAFDQRDRLAAYERQGHKCVYCGKSFDFGEMHADHITPWSKGGRTVPENCQMLCRDCNLKKGNQ